MKYTLLIFTLIFYSCSKKKPVYLNSINNADSPVQVFDSISLVPLETNKESILGARIKKIVSHGSNMYVLDKSQNSILRFSKDGLFINKLENLGNGPGEYINLLDFIINEKTQTLELLAPFKLINYTLDLEFISERTFPTIANHFERLNDSTIVYYQYGNIKRLSTYLTNNQKIIDSFHEVPNYFSHLINHRTSPFSKVGEIIYYKSLFSNDNFQVTNRGLKKGLNFFPDYDVDLRELPEGRKAEYYKKYQLNIATPFNYRSIISESFLQCSYLYKGNGGVIVKSRHDDSIIRFNPSKDHFLYVGRFADSSCTFGTMETQYVLKLLKSRKYQELINKIPEISEEDISISNPFIVKYYFKKSFN